MLEELPKETKDAGGQSCLEQFKAITNIHDQAIFYFLDDYFGEDIQKFLEGMLS